MVSSAFAQAYGVIYSRHQNVLIQHVKKEYHVYWYWLSQFLLSEDDSPVVAYWPQLCIVEKARRTHNDSTDCLPLTSYDRKLQAEVATYY